jgi:GMP synthase-like glutamine amidotransferase
MTLGLLVCGVFSETIMQKYDGHYEDFFIKGLSAADASLSFKSYRVFENDFPRDVNECDAWLITGSVSGVYEDLAWIKRLLSFVQAAYAADVPLIGICFGHQLIAQALGGHVIKSPKGWGLGRQCYDLHADFEGVNDKKLALYAIHQDQVVEVPPQAQVLASSAHCPIAALRYKGRALSFQPHPEFSREFETDLIDSLIDNKLTRAQAEAAFDTMKSKPVHNQQVMQAIASFIRSTDKPDCD